MIGLTVLSYGGGQDSTAILYKLFLDPEWKAKYVHGDLLIIMSETGDEHPETYAYVKHIKQFVESQGGNFVHLTPDMGYHSASWHDLKHQWRLHTSTGSKGYNKTCTSNLKIKPIYRFIDDYVAHNYLTPADKYIGGKVKQKSYDIDWTKYKYHEDKDEDTAAGKRAIKTFHRLYGKIWVLIGFAEGEEKRCSKPNQKAGWQNDCVTQIYPLIEQHVDRFKAIEIIKGYNQPVPPPSNCMMCPFTSEIELMWLERFYPDVYAEWVDIEAKKLEKHKDLLTQAIGKEGSGKGGSKTEKVKEGYYGTWRKMTPKDNFGVWTNKTLPQVLAETKAKHPNMTDKELQDYKMVHGHQITTSY